MVVVGPEDPLVNGIHDFFLNDRLLQNVSVIGPQKAAAELEGSKEFAKKFLFKHNIPTKVVISEYLSVSEYFLEKIQIGYLNAILDKISKQIRK